MEKNFKMMGKKWLDWNKLGWSQPEQNGTHGNAKKGDQVDYSEVITKKEIIRQQITYE